MKTGYITLPLHYGRAPRWLFQRMVKLSRAIVEAIVMEFGPDELLKRLSDPLWFQAFGCLLGFDWHSSGLTTTTGGALREALKDIQYDLGLFIAGGKGRTSRKTPEEILTISEKTGIEGDSLVYVSRMTAKVDSSLLQDGYQIYHHIILFTKEGKWAVIQQGLNEIDRTARRYHWLGEKIESFVKEPHTGFFFEKIIENVLDLTAMNAEDARKILPELASRPPDKTIKELNKLKVSELPRRHAILIKDIKPENLRKILLSTYERVPQNLEELLSLRGVGPKTIRALALVSDLIYGAKPSYEDPVIYSYAHGGKDGHPYPVARGVYDRSIEVLERAITRAKLGKREELETLRKLEKLFTQ
ncbi:MAG: DUF763 domain-containing protein [Candidatus Hydrothermae bacterium]|nr:DUF763 domain-containing protein [Candidatus Hydrothermae bacterium]